MTSGVTPEHLKLELAKYSQEQLKYLITLIDKAGIELNIRFVREVNKNNHIEQIDLTSVKKNKEIYDAFVKLRDEHIKYFKKFPKYVSQKITEHLEKSKKSVNFDAQKLAQTLNLTEGISTRHAAFIARDQLGKFNGAINEAQANYVGSKKYIWRTSQDNRVREEHAKREGEIFYYARPPKDGNPGMAIRCRCTAEPIIYEDEV